MNKRIFLIIPVIILSMAMKQDKPAYKLFNEKGRTVKYKKLLKEAKDADIIFFGELHNNPICHWLQLELTQDVYNENNNLVLGAEMIEADNQEVLNKYLNNEINKDELSDQSRLWKNYKTDYEPLVNFAKDHKLPFIATNIPRKYASQVNKQGLESLESLPDSIKQFIAPLPIKYDPELKGYKSMLEMLKGMPHVTDNLPKAQAIKDATMAHFILQNFKDGQTFIHYNGSYHSKDFQGIMWYILQEKPDLKIVTIASEEQEDIKKLNPDYFNLANFILVTPQTMTKTY